MCTWTKLVSAARAQLSTEHIVMDLAALESGRLALIEGTSVDISSAEGGDCDHGTTNAAGTFQCDLLAHDAEAAGGQRRGRMIGAPPRG